MIKPLSSSALLGSLLAISAVVTPAIADESEITPWYTSENCLYRASTSDTDHCYSMGDPINYGAASYDSATEITTLASTPTESAYAYIDSAVEVTAGDYIVMIAFTQASEVRGGDDLTGLPYVYGYQMTDDTHIDQYMQGQDTLYNGGEAGNWDLSYGVFPVTNDEVTRIRFFMNQGLYGDSEYNGSTAQFKRPGVFVVANEQEAASLVEAYVAALDPTVVAVVDTNRIRAKNFKTTWEPQENAEQYIVRVEKPNGDFIKSTVTSDGAPIDDADENPTLKIKQLKPDHEYSVQVRAVVNEEKGDWSDSEIVHTDSL